jgi:uncharacterized protein YhaN
MRLRRLDLTRYGRFTNESIDFGLVGLGKPDLHIVYGPNEAGKSTALAAFLDLLFGIGAQSPYNFLHAYSSMRIGGALEFNDGPREFIRIKRPQAALLDASERPIPEGAIRAELGSLDRDAYRTMFSLDDESLEEGGEDILASKGDLGELLFSASAGLAGLSRSLLAIRGEAESFYKYRGRTGGLVDLKSRLANLKAERDSIDTLAVEYARLIDVRDRATSQYEAAMAERARIQSRVDEIQRQLTALPRLFTLRDLRNRLVPFSDVPTAPASWKEEQRVLQDEEIKLGVRRETLIAEIERLVRELEPITIDEAALGLRGRVEQLSDLRARYVTADKDLPERRLQLGAAELSITGILARLGREGETDLSRFVLSAAVVGRLRELIEARSGVESRNRAAKIELAEAQCRLREVQDKLHLLGVDPKASGDSATTMKFLADTVATLRAADHDTRRHLAIRARENATATLADRIHALTPWGGDTVELIGMQCPSAATLQHWKSTLDQFRSAISAYVKDIERQTSEILRLEAESNGIIGATGVVTDQEAAAVRAGREQTWAAHRRSLDEVSADAFEDALRRDDLIVAGRASHMTDLAKLNQNQQTLVVATAALARTTELKEAATLAQRALLNEIKGAVRLISPCLMALTLNDLGEWLTLREQALEARDAVVAAERDLKAANSDEAMAIEKLRSALKKAGVPHKPEASFESIWAVSHDVLDREGNVRSLRNFMDGLERDVGRRQLAAEQAALDDREWIVSWETACRGCWLGEGPEVPTLATVRESLTAVAQLPSTLEQKAGLVDRIEKMERDRQAFQAEVEALTGELGIQVDDGPILSVAQHLVDHVRVADQERVRRDKLLDELDQARTTERALAENLAVHGQKKNAMTAFFGVSSLAEVAEKLVDLEKRDDLSSQAERTAREITGVLRTSNIAEAEIILEATDRPALDMEIITLKARFEDQDKRCHELFATRSQAIDQVETIGGDAKVAEIEERRRTTLLEIEEGAMRYLRLRTGAAAAEQALTMFRERHRSSMLAQASQAFRTISRGNYAGLVAHPDKDGETLLAMSADGSSKAADQLSKGTRFQLYLALRVAGYHEFIRTHAPVPFIADDIMETFDDIRAEEAFRLLMGMAQDGQVIYLTHHQHLCEIAKSVFPTVRIHELAATAAVRRPEVMVAAE